MGLENIMQSEKSKKEKARHCMTSSISAITQKASERQQNRNALQPQRTKERLPEEGVEGGMN